MLSSFSQPRSARLIRAALLVSVSLAALPPALARADIVSPSVTELPNFGGGQSEPAWNQGNVTDSGVVVGDSPLDSNWNTDHAFRWTAAGGMVDLGTLGGTNSYATSISADGSVVVGEADNAASTRYAFRWTQTGGMVNLGSLGGVTSNGSASWANGISADGSSVVGFSTLADNSTSHAFRWTQATGMVDLGSLSGTNSYANGVSADGSIVVGAADLTGGAQHAFRWTQATGMADLGTLGGTYSNAYGTSADGGVVVGPAQNASNIYYAYRWTQAGGMVNLGTLGGVNNRYASEANAVSADGNVVVGDSLLADNTTSHAFRWTQATGMKDLNTLLSNAGVNINGVTLNYANGISPNGKYIVGAGTFPDSTYEAFLVCYDPNNGCVGLTTGSSQQASTQQLADHQRATMIQSRTTANEVLGMTRPMDTARYVQAGGMFGSAVGYSAGQYSNRGITVLGGIAYGAQDYPDIRQASAPTIAAALRYTFDDPFGDKAKALQPFAEIGSWVTPRAGMTLTRSYANGSGSSTGSGDTTATSWVKSRCGAAALGWTYLFSAPFVWRCLSSPP